MLSHNLLVKHHSNQYVAEMHKQYRLKKHKTIGFNKQI